MNAARIKSFFTLLVLALIGFGPISLTALIGLYVVGRRPAWFIELVEAVYGGKRIRPSQAPRASAYLRARYTAALIGLLILDIAPIPIVGSIGLYIVLARPAWFLRLSRNLYAGFDRR
ncbi:MAG: hypothetical protein U1E83_07960 [Methylotetracoccus sp.]